MSARAVLAAAATTIALTVGGAAFAAAEAPEPVPVEVGWWTSAQVGGVPVGLSTLVADGGLQVANGSDGPISIGAVRFAAPDGGTAQLLLHLAAGSTAETAAVAACPITDAWEPVHAGTFDAAPTWDCDLGAAGGAYDPVTRTMTFSFEAGFVRDGTVDVMLLPVEGALPFNVTSDPPGADAVSVRPGADGTASSTPTTTAPVAPAPSEPAWVPPPDGPLTLPDVAAPVVAPPTAADDLPSPLPTAPQVAVARPAEDSTAARVVGLTVLLLAGASTVLLWRGAPLPWARAAGSSPRGVGRFARPRTDPPPTI